MESEDEDYGEELPSHHTFSEDDGDLFSDDEMFNSEEFRGVRHKFRQEFEH